MKYSTQEKKIKMRPRKTPWGEYLSFLRYKNMVATWNDGQDKELHVSVFCFCLCFRREVCGCLRNSVHELHIRYKTTNERNDRLFVSLPCQQTEHVARHRSNMANFLSRYEERFLPSLDMKFVPASSCSDISEKNITLKAVEIVLERNVEHRAFGILQKSSR